MKSKNTLAHIAVFMGIIAGFVFLTGVLIGINKGGGALIPCLIFIGTILVAIALILFGQNNTEKQV
jgi:hypothetical protein